MRNRENFQQFFMRGKKIRMIGEIGADLIRRNVLASVTMRFCLLHI
jgi:hypothetical protein